MNRWGLAEKFPWVLRKEQILEFLKCWKFGDNPELTKIPKDVMRLICESIPVDFSKRSLWDGYGFYSLVIRQNCFGWHAHLGSFALLGLTCPRCLSFTEVREWRCHHEKSPGQHAKIESFIENPRFLFSKEIYNACFQLREKGCL